MRESFTPEEVTQIEDKAYEVGEIIGRRLERKRIVALLEAELYSCSKCDRDGASLIALIKGENK